MAARKRDPAAALHSTYQKQLDVLKRKREAAEQETAKFNAEAALSKRYTAHLERLTGISDPAGREEYMTAMEEAVEASERDLVSREKGTVGRLLSAQYGVPVAELEGFDDPRDMKIAAVKWERELRLHRSNGTEPEAEGAQN